MTPTKDIRETNNSFALGMFGTGFDLLMLAVMFGGSAFFLQWAVWFFVVGWAATAIVRKGADAVDWVYGKLPANPLRRNGEGDT